MKNLLLFLTTAMFLAGCDTKDIINTKPDVKKEVNSDVVAGLRSGALQVFKQTVKTEDASKNVVISPLSIQYAVGMAANGASGNTLEELMRVFDQPAAGLDVVNNNFAALADNIIDDITDYKMSVSNGLFFDPNRFQMNDSYKASLDNNYKPTIESLNFSTPDDALKNINGWVSEQTQKRIPRVLDHIQDNEFMFLINAIYMRASWDMPFAPEATATGEFKDSKGNMTPVKMMTQRNNIAYFSGDEEKAIVLPLSDGRLQALFILPQKKDILSYIEETTPQRLNTIMENTSVRDLMLSLPKFEALLKYDMKKILQDMGIQTPFSESADFTKMGTATNRILLTRALHDVFLKMDEKGLEGAAVTTIGVGVTSMPEYVGFDRPFLMAVLDKATGTYLFLGKIEKP